MRNDPAWLYRVGHQAMVHHPLRDNEIGFGERGVDGRVVDRLAVWAHAGAARHERNGEVVREVWVDDGGLARHCQLGVDDGGQLFVVHDDGIRGITRDVAIACDDECHGFAGVADDIRGDGTMRRGRKRRADRHRIQQGHDLLAGEDSLHALYRGRGTGVDGADATVRDVTALERDVLHSH